MYIFIRMISLLLDVLNNPSLDRFLYLAIGKLHNGKLSSDFTIIMLDNRKTQIYSKTDTYLEQKQQQKNRIDHGLQSPQFIPNTHYSA